MKTTLRRAALAVLLLGLVGWAAGGARFGWTQTSVVTMQRDEITGIDFPVRRDTFIPGVEIPLLAIVVAGAFVGASWVLSRRTAAVRA
jgi:hypothetical protein